MTDCLDGVTKRGTIPSMAIEDEQLAETMFHHRLNDVAQHMAHRLDRDADRAREIHVMTAAAQPNQWQA